MRLLPLLLLLAVCSAEARVIHSILWISGGADELMWGGDEAPGWISLSARVAEEPGCWIDHGGGTALACLRETSDLRLPDIIAPGEDLLRTGGVGFLREHPLPWTLLNVGRLPQFPEANLPTVPVRVWQQADGLRVRVAALVDDRAPWRVPPLLLHPMRVLSANDSLRSALPGWRTEPAALNVLLLPEGADATAWSRNAPEFPILVQAAADPPEVTAIDGEKRLRVRPARNGRALIRIEVSWDNVSGEYGAPRGEIVWVRAADPARLPLPDCAKARLRPGRSPSPARVESDLFLLPAARSAPTASALPDARRAALTPRDSALLRATVPTLVAREWINRTPGGYVWRGAPAAGRETRLVLTAEAAAGLNGELRDVRAVLDDPETRLELLPFTLRDVLPHLP